jgi:esterase FrsA
MCSVSCLICHTARTDVPRGIDTLISTQDMMEIAHKAPRGQLHPDGDQCAMGHYREWPDDTPEWLKVRLTS